MKRLIIFFHFAYLCLFYRRYSTSNQGEYFIGGSCCSSTYLHSCIWGRIPRFQSQGIDSLSHTSVTIWWISCSSRAPALLTSSAAIPSVPGVFLFFSRRIAFRVSSMLGSSSMTLSIWISLFDRMGENFCWNKLSWGLTKTQNTLKIFIRKQKR